MKATYDFERIKARQRETTKYKSSFTKNYFYIKKSIVSKRKTARRQTAVDKKDKENFDKSPIQPGFNLHQTEGVDPLERNRKLNKNKDRNKKSTYETC